MTPKQLQAAVLRTSATIDQFEMAADEWFFEQAHIDAKKLGEFTNMLLRSNPDEIRTLTDEWIVKVAALAHVAILQSSRRVFEKEQESP